MGESLSEGALGSCVEIGSGLRPVAASLVRAKIADAVLDRGKTETALGSITLWDHQRDAVARLREAIAEFGGALLADEVGLGKTYVALAVAAQYSAPLVVAPAALRATWARAFEAAAIRRSWISAESLSRGGSVEMRPDLVVIDEAHHARNPATRRYRALAALCETADVLLVSATPIHNARRDLLALFALFLGSHAYAVDDAALVRLVVRRTHEAVRPARDAPCGEVRLPEIAPAIRIAITDDPGVADRILALPPAVPPDDGGSADALVIFTLVRQWASSVGALRGALRRRIGRTRALLDTLRTGRLPSRAEVDAWLIGDDAQQLAFAELLAPARRESHTHRWHVDALLASAERHERALCALRASLGDDADLARAAALRSVLESHPGERVLAFTQFADTVDAYWRCLRALPGVCALTAAGGRVAGGRVSRAEAIERFAPAANGAHRAPRSEEVSLLVTTDILSEGVNLQDASVIVHLDLPWTAARVEQRVGRVARAGSPHPRVAVYTMSPPASGEAVVAIERRLREKIIAAAVSVGAPASHLADMCDAALSISPPAAGEVLRSILQHWSRERSHDVEDAGGTWCAAIRAAEHGWLALVANGRIHRLVAALGNRRGVDAALVASVARLASDSTAACGFDDIARAAAINALDHLREWLAADRASSLAGVPEIPVSRFRRASLARFASVESLPRVRRVEAGNAAANARRVSAGMLSHQAELSMRAAADEVDTTAWLSKVAALAKPRHERASTGQAQHWTVAALLVLVP